MNKIPPVQNGESAIVLLSGGLDSQVVAGMVKAAGYRVHALTIDYNQRHRKELESASAIARTLGLESHIILPLDLSSFGGSSLTDTAMAVPKNGIEPGIPSTYVPARNTIFLSLALGWAEALGARHIAIGVNALDYSGYPDCRPAFIQAFSNMARAATKAGVEGYDLTILTPLIDMTKAEIAQAAVDLGLDAGMSWSCYDPAPDGKPCGLCDSCRLRAKGFGEAGLVDPAIR